MNKKCLLVILSSGSTIFGADVVNKQEINNFKASLRQFHTLHDNNAPFGQQRMIAQDAYQQYKKIFDPNRNLPLKQKEKTKLTHDMRNIIGFIKRKSPQRPRPEIQTQTNTDAPVTVD
jgi:hypothetical protein